MRNKKAKALRKVVEETVPHLEGVVVAPKKLTIKRLSNDLDPTTGKRKVVAMSFSQRVLGTCKRAVYQQCKAHYKLGGGIHG